MYLRLIRIFSGTFLASSAIDTGSILESVHIQKKEYSKLSMDYLIHLFKIFSMKSSLTGIFFFKEYDWRVRSGSLGGGLSGRFLGWFSWEETFLLVDLLLVRDVNHLLVTGRDGFLPAVNTSLTSSSSSSELPYLHSFHSIYLQSDRGLLTHVELFLIWSMQNIIFLIWSM